MINWATPVARLASGWKNLPRPTLSFETPAFELTLASPKGGQPPIDPKSDLPENQTDAMSRFKKDKTAGQESRHIDIETELNDLLRNA